MQESYDISNDLIQTVILLVYYTSFTVCSEDKKNIS